MTIDDQKILRYWVEAFDGYYPSGGLRDIKGRYATLEEAEARAKEIRGEYDFVKVHDIMGLILEDHSDPS